MRNFNFDISTMFSGFGTGSVFGGINLSDYSSIKSGSYGKLLKSYYAEQKNTDSTKKTSTVDKLTTIDKTKKQQTVDTTGLSQMKKEADGLKSAADSLNQDDLWKLDDGNYDVDKIADAVKSFANEYNDVIDQAAKVNSKDVSQSMYYMKSMTNTMSKMLSKVGVSVGTDGKLSVDEDALKKANMTSVKNLFSGSVSYGSQIADKASEISKAAVMNSSVYGKSGALSSNLNSMFSKWI